MPARFPAFLQITSRFHFQPTATGELARPTSFRLASSVVLARFLQLEFLSVCLWPGRSTLRRLANTVEFGNYARKRLPRQQLRRRASCAQRDKLGAREARRFVSKEAREISARMQREARSRSWRQRARRSQFLYIRRALKRAGAAVGR